MARSDAQPERGPWPRLRGDLEISSPKEGEDGYVVLVRDPSSGELFEFSEEDYFLLSCLDGTLGAAGTMNRFEEDFEQRIGEEQLQQFIAMVSEWGLLEGTTTFVVARAETLPLAGETDPDSGILMPSLGTQGSAGLGGNLEDRQGTPGQPKRARPLAIARPGLLAPEQGKPAERVERMERQEPLREPLEPAATPGPRRGGGMGRGAGLGRGRGGGGMGGGRGGGGAGGGMGGGRGGGMGDAPEDWQPQQSVAEGEPLHRTPALTLIEHPQRFFTVLGTWLSPFRWVAYLTPITLALGLWTVLSHIGAFASDYKLYRQPMTLAVHLIFSFFTDNLAVQIARGCVAAICGAEVLRFGVRMAFGIVPRFATQVGSVAGLDKRRLLWVHGSTLLVRLNLFAFAGMAWYMARGSGTGLPGMLLVLTTMGALSFCLSANPLMKTPGYYVLVTLLEIPDLRKRATRALRSYLKGNAQDDEENAFALRMYALASFIFMFALAAFILWLIGSWLELNYAGLGVSVFCVLVLFLVLRFRSNMKTRAEIRGEKRVAERVRNREARIAELRMGAAGGGGGGMGRGGAGGAGGGGMGRGGGGGMGRGMGAEVRGPRGGRMGPAGGMGASAPRALARLPAGRVPGEVQAPEPIAPKKRNPFIRFGLLIAFIIVCFLPYHYEPGGPVTTLPLQQQEVHAEISGVLGQIPFNGGESVKEGTLIAKINSLEEEKNVQTTRADIARRQADLEQLLSTPRPEEVQLAQQALDTAKTSAQFSSEEAGRLEVVYKAGHVSLEDYQEARKKADVDAQQVLEETANLQKVKAGPHPKEIEALRYEIAGLQEQLVYYENELEKTKLYMPFDGRITTINLRDKLGQYLEKGDLFANVENDESVRVEFAIPQSDVSEFALGADVRIKIWTYPDRIFPGKVIDIAPSVDEELEQGMVLKVTTLIPNQDGTLKAGMTGYGKIDGGTKPVIVAFTRAIVRFFLIEFWSWLP